MSTLAASAFCSMNTRRGSTLMWIEPLTGNMGTVLFGSNIGVLTALVSGLAAAYFVSPQFSWAIDD